MSMFRSMVVAGSIVMGSAVAASAQQGTAAPRRPGAHAQAARVKRAKNLRRALFAGIKLTDVEKANVKAVHAKYAPQMKALREQAKPKLQAAREARQRGDTAALRGLWQQSAAQREQAKALLLAEQKDLRAALAPEHQARFDANVQRVEKRVAVRGGKAFGKLRAGRATKRGTGA